MAARRWARRIERTCCVAAKYLPLLFVYGLTTWGLWVMVMIGNSSIRSRWIGTWSSAFGTVLYLLANWAYTVAVFTPPGSPTNDDGYGLLPTRSAPPTTFFTVKSNGQIRFCKKCHAHKPDRAHHCSTCGRCVLKMDHHCPWLATCVGLRNYKPFLLFLLYVTAFSFYAFAISFCWIWDEVLDEQLADMQTLLPVNYVVLCVLAGIVGLVVGTFTGWHVALAVRGQTTLEGLERTRYLSPLRKTFNHAHNPANQLPYAAQQIVDFHANALPGVTRPEEGEERLSSAHGPQRRPLSYADLERDRSRRQYEEYLDEQDSEKLPNAFDLGWRRNLGHLFGPSPWLWALPICNTTGDGWSWEPSPRWLEAREKLKAEREAQQQREINAGWGVPDDSPVHIHTTSARGAGSLVGHSSSSPGAGRRTPSKADRILGRDPDLYADGAQDVPLRRLSPRGRALEDDLEDSEDDDDDYGDVGAYHAAPKDEEARLQGDSRREAERRALGVVTNRPHWYGRGGASGMLRKAGQPKSVGSRPLGTQYEEGVD